MSLRVSETMNIFNWAVKICNFNDVTSLWCNWQLPRYLWCICSVRTELLWVNCCDGVWVVSFTVQHLKQGLLWSLRNGTWNNNKLSWKKSTQSFFRNINYSVIVLLPIICISFLNCYSMLLIWVIICLTKVVLLPHSSRIPFMLLK